MNRRQKFEGLKAVLRGIRRTIVTAPESKVLATANLVTHSGARSAAPSWSR